jgi:hypothetical protein
MGTREMLHTLLDELPENALPGVARYLEAVAAGCSAEDPYDDEPLSPDEVAMLAQAREEIARGDVISHEELGARITARRERA